MEQIPLSISLLKSKVTLLTPVKSFWIYTGRREVNIYFDLIAVFILSSILKYPWYFLSYKYSPYFWIISTEKAKGSCEWPFSVRLHLSTFMRNIFTCCKITYFHLCCSKTRMYFNDKGFGLVKTLSGSKITHKLSSTHQWDCSIAPYSIRNIHYIGLPILAQGHMLLKSKKCTWIPISDFLLNCGCLTVLSKWSTFVKKQNSFMEVERKDQRKQNKQIWFRRCAFMVQGKWSWQLLKQNIRKSTSTGKGVLVMQGSPGTQKERANPHYRSRRKVKCYSTGLVFLLLANSHVQIYANSNSLWVLNISQISFFFSSTSGTHLVLLKCAFFLFIRNLFCFRFVF